MGAAHERGAGGVVAFELVGVEGLPGRPDPGLDGVVVRLT